MTICITDCPYPKCSSLEVNEHLAPLPLCKYEKDFAIKIAQQLLPDRAANLIQVEVPSNLQNWLLSIYAFCLRIYSDHIEIKGSPFYRTLNIYQTLLASALSSNQFNLLKIYLIHLSQAFQNPYFYQKDQDQYLINKVIDWLTEFFLKGYSKVPKDILVILIKILLCGAKELNKVQQFGSNEQEFLQNQEEAKSRIFSLIINAILKSDDTSEEFLSLFEPQMDKILLHGNGNGDRDPVFVSSLITHFQLLFIELLKINDGNGKETKNKAVLMNQIDFFKSKIDSFPSQDQGKAFDLLIKSYNYSLNNEDKTLKPLLPHWDTHYLSDKYFSWYQKERWEPLFEILDHDRNQKILDSTREQLISVMTSKNNLYENSPIYLHNFSIHYPDILKLEEISDELKSYIITFFDTIRSSSLLNDFSTRIHLIFLILELLPFIHDEAEKMKFLDLLSMDTINPHINLISLFSLLFTNTPKRFWEQVKKLMTFNFSEKYTSLVLLTASFAMHVVPGYADETDLPPDLWDQLRDPSNEEMDRIILGLYSISEGTPYFSLRSVEGANLLDIISKDNTKFLYKMVRLSLSCNGATISLPPIGKLPPDGMKEFREPDSIYEENFIDDNVIISIIGKNHILIRHALGTVVYEVEDLSRRSAPIPNKALPQIITVPEPPKPNELYHSLINVDEEDIQHAKEADDMFRANETLIPYQEPKSISIISDAHAALCDIGFIGTPIQDRVRPLNCDLTALDNVSPVAQLHIPVVRLNANGQMEQASSEDLLVKEILKLLTPVSPVPNLPYKEVDENKYFFRSAIADIEFTNHVDNCCNAIILVNDSGLKFNNKTISLNQFKMILLITPIQNQFAIDLVFNVDQIPLFSFFKENNCYQFSCSKENLGKFVIITSLVFYGALPDGIDYFISGYKKRIEKIHSLWEDSKSEKSKFVSALLSCGQPRKKNH